VVVQPFIFNEDGIVELDVLLCDIVDPEQYILITGEFNSRTSNIDDFIPRGGVEHTSVHDINTVDTFNIPRESHYKGNTKKHCYQRARPRASTWWMVDNQNIFLVSIDTAPQLDLVWLIKC